MIFGRSRDRAFVKEIVAKLARELPPQQMDTRRQSLTVNRVTRLLERSFKAAMAYQQQERLGFIRRAMLANAFRWELKSSGYPDDFVEVATEGLVVELSRSARGDAPGPQG